MAKSKTSDKNQKLFMEFIKSSLFIKFLEILHVVFNALFATHITLGERRVMAISFCGIVKLMYLNAVKGQSVCYTVFCADKY